MGDVLGGAEVFAPGEHVVVDVVDERGFGAEPGCDPFGLRVPERDSGCGLVGDAFGDAPCRSAEVGIVARGPANDVAVRVDLSQRDRGAETLAAARPAHEPYVVWFSGACERVRVSERYRGAAVERHRVDVIRSGEECP